MSSEVRKAAPSHKERGLGAGLGEGRWQLRSVTTESGGGTHFSLGKLFAYQLTLVKEKNIHQAICSQSGAGVGPGASHRSGGQTQFQNPRQLPPWIILGRGSTRRHARLRGISRRSEAVCTPSRACQLLPGPGHRPAPASRNTLLPTSEATSAGVRFLGEEGARESQGGALPAKAGRPCCPLLCLLGVSHSLHLPPSTGTPGICPIPGPIPPPLAPQGSRVAGPSFCE